jgi:two-component system, sensor histidine kinase
MTKWIHAIAQTTTYLGVAVILIIWGGIYFLTSQERERDYQEAVRQGGNLTRVLEEYIRRVVEETDSALLAVRESYQDDPQHFDIARWKNSSWSRTDFILQYGIANSDGFVVQSSHGQLSTPIYVGDRAHFKFHATNETDQLYIGAPVTGYISGKLAIEFTRRRSNPDGTFAGTVATSLSVRELEKFFSSLDIGRSGVVSLVGLDGVVRARGGSEPGVPSFAGVSIANSPLFPAVRQKSDGNYWNTTASSANFDSVSRLISYRVVTGLPLVAVVDWLKKASFSGPMPLCRSMS